MTCSSGVWAGTLSEMGFTLFNKVLLKKRNASLVNKEALMFKDRWQRLYKPLVLHWGQVWPMEVFQLFNKKTLIKIV